MVPLNIFQTWFTLLLPLALNETVADIMTSQPDFKYHLFDDIMMNEYMLSYYPGEIYQAYDDLIPGAFRADLWRLCVLYREGGIYMDMGMKPVLGYDLKQLTTKNHFVRDLVTSGSGIYNAFMVSAPGNPQLLEAIHAIVDKIQQRYYGYGVTELPVSVLSKPIALLQNTHPGASLNVTGPLALNHIITRDVDIVFGNGFLKYKEIPIIKRKDGTYRTEQAKSVLPKYHSLWDKRRVYKNRIIPQIVHYTFKNNNLPSSILDIIENNKRLNPDYEFIFYNDTDVDNFIRTNFPERIYSAFKMLNPSYGAMKADFFRYCVMYIKGGVYIDIKMSLTKNLYEILKLDDECLLDEGNHYEFYRNKPTYEQWLLICKPGHVYFKDMIEHMVSLIEKRYNPPVSKSGASRSKQRVMKLTGPDAFTDSIYESIKTHGILHRHVKLKSFTHRDDKKAGVELYKINNLTHYSHISESLYVDVQSIPYIIDHEHQPYNPKALLNFGKSRIKTLIKNKLSELSGQNI